MRDFKSSNRLGDKRDSSRSLLYDAVCAECGKDCKVPFKPSGERPVYCSDCFEKKGGNDSNRSKERRSPPRRDFGVRDSGRSLRNNLSDRSIFQLAEEIKSLNTKLDLMIDLLTLAGEKKPELIEVKTEKIKKPKIKKADESIEEEKTVKKRDSKKEKLTK